MYSLLVLLLTGTFLTFWFVPSSGRVVYDGVATSRSRGWS